MSDVIQTILLTRTVPFLDFSTILAWVYAQFPQKRIILLLQEDAASRCAEAQRHPYHLIPAGPFHFPGERHPICTTLKNEDIQLFIIAANNPQFSGYDEFIRLASACAALRILLVTKELQVKEVAELPSANSASELSKNYWQSIDTDNPQLVGVYGMGGGGLTEVLYRHFFEVKHLKKIVPFERRMNVLEFGCGNGRWILSMAPLVQHYVGVDFSAAALSVAREQIKNNKLTNVTLIQSSVFDFSSSEVFDVVYFSGVSQYMENHDLANILRHIQKNSKETTILIDRSTVNFKRREVRQESGYFSIFRTPAELAQIMAAAGYNLVYQKRSYRFLRCPRWLRRDKTNKFCARLVKLTRPFSFYLMRCLSLLADTISPIPFEGGDRSHDFFIFRQKK